MFKLLIALATVAALLIPGIPRLSAEPNVSAPQPAITAQEAEKAALDQAGLTAESVTGLHSHFDGDERVPHWDVEFFHENYEYDFEVDSTGAILNWSREYEGRQAPQTTQPAQPTQPTQPAQPAQPAQAAISAEEAKAIALQHAGLSAGEVTGLRAKLDRDDGVPEYEVEFRQGRLEFEYDIHAETGAILSWDKDYDD